MSGAEGLAGIRGLGQVVGRDGFVDRVREWFEGWAREAPRECSTARFPVRAAWPWQYRNYAVELAWQASRELARELAAERDRSATLAAALLRLQRQVARLEVEVCELRRRSGERRFETLAFFAPTVRFLDTGEGGDDGK